MPVFNGVQTPTDGQAITKHNGHRVPDNPIIPFIEGDGTGPDIWRASQRVFDAAVEKAYGGKRRIVWYEIFAGEKAYKRFNEWLPKGTLDAIQAFAIVNRAAVPLAAAADLPGPVTALWTSAGSSATAVVRDLGTGRYAAYRITVACGA